MHRDEEEGEEGTLIVCKGCYISLFTYLHLHNVNLIYIYIFPYSCYLRTELFNYLPIYPCTFLWTDLLV